MSPVRVDELKCKPKYEMWIKLVGLDRRYLWKLSCGRMKPKDWFSLFFDILVVVAEFHLKHFKDKFSKQLKK